jgi:acetylcholinesterase
LAANNILTNNMLRLIGAAALLGTAVAQNVTLPEIDLGYEVYQAAGFNVRHTDYCIYLLFNTTQDTGNFYNFSNIRYAAPPVGNLRFAPPQAPAQNRSSVNKGGVSRYA